jgi:hypothetical protein
MEDKKKFFELVGVFRGGEIQSQALPVGLYLVVQELFSCY